EQQFSKALALDPQCSVAHVGNAYVTLNRLQSSSMSVISQRDAMLTKAQSECEIALRSEPNMPEALVVLGMVQRAQGKLDDAKANFSKSIKEEPIFANAFVYRGLIDLEQGDTSSAIADFKEAIRIRSANSTAHYALGKAYLKLGQLDDAQKELNTALSLNANSAPTHVAMGDVYRAQGNSVAAVKEYNAAIAVKAENADSYLRLADIYESRGDLELSASNLRSGLALNPDSIDLHRRLGDILLRNEKVDDALKEYTTVLSYSPSDVPAINGMTTALMLKSQKEASGAFFVSNNFEAADRMIQKAIQMNPNNLQLRLASAKLRALSGQPVDLASVGTPTNDAERIAYAQALLAQLKFQESSQEMNMVIQNCANANDAFAVADMSLMIHDLDSASAAYNKAGAFPGQDNAARAQRGQSSIQQTREKARQSLTLASDLSRKGQLASAIDNYRACAYADPRRAEAHLGLAEALQKFGKKDSASLREASLHYNAYISLEPNLPQKEREKIAKKAETCQEHAYKLDRGQSTSKIAGVFQPIGNLGKKVGSGIRDVFE
ncbi:MAG: tetratricopeptide repeat protein, partial [Cyanobacteria bacterium]|nr:tetratricopeptide repeat protein [Cyanobacteriota bacterium]